MHKPIIVDLNFRIATSLHRPNIQFAVYHPQYFIIGSPGLEPPQTYGFWIIRGPESLAWTEREPSVNRAWTEREPDQLWPAKDQLWLAKDQLWPWTEREPSVKPQEPFFQCGNFCQTYNFLRGNAKNLLCICSGMSALVAVHCNLERPIRGYDL